MNEENTTPEPAEGHSDPLQKKIDDLSARLKKLEEAEPVNQLLEVSKDTQRHKRREQSSAFFGVVLITFGGFWIFKELGWWDFNIPFWPSVLVVIGLYILITSGHQND